jgi:hypothetical protein
VRRRRILRKQVFTKRRRTKDEYAIILSVVARRPNVEKERVLSQEDIKYLQHNLAHLSLDAVREFYQRGKHSAAG